MDLVVFLSERCKFAYFSLKFYVYRIKILNMHLSNQALLRAVNWTLVAMIKRNPALFIIVFWNRSLVSSIRSVIPVHLHILGLSDYRISTTRSLPIKILGLKLLFYGVCHEFLLCALWADDVLGVRDETFANQRGSTRWANKAIVVPMSSFKRYKTGPSDAYVSKKFFFVDG